MFQLSVYFVALTISLLYLSNCEFLLCKFLGTFVWCQKLIAFCRFGGEFRQDEIIEAYIGGQAYAIEADEEMTFSSFIDPYFH